MKKEHDDFLHIFHSYFNQVGSVNNKRDTISIVSANRYTKQSNILNYLIAFIFFCFFRFYYYESEWIYFLSLLSFVFFLLYWYFCLHQRNALSGREWQKFMWHFYAFKTWKSMYFYKFWQSGYSLTKDCMCGMFSYFLFIAFAIIFHIRLL